METALRHPDWVNKLIIALVYYPTEAAAPEGDKGCFYTGL